MSNSISKSYNNFEQGFYLLKNDIIFCTFTALEKMFQVDLFCGIVNFIQKNYPKKLSTIISNVSNECLNASK